MGGITSHTTSLDCDYGWHHTTYNKPWLRLCMASCHIQQALTLHTTSPDCDCGWHHITYNKPWLWLWLASHHIQQALTEIMYGIMPLTTSPDTTYNKPWLWLWLASHHIQQALTVIMVVYLSSWHQSQDLGTELVSSKGWPLSLRISTTPHHLLLTHIWGYRNIHKSGDVYRTSRWPLIVTGKGHPFKGNDLFIYHPKIYLMKRTSISHRKWPLDLSYEMDLYICCRQRTFTSIIGKGPLYLSYEIDLYICYRKRTFMSVKGKAPLYLSQEKDLYICHRKRTFISVIWNRPLYVIRKRQIYL